MGISYLRWNSFDVPDFFLLFKPADSSSFVFTEKAGVDKVEQGKVLGQVVLDGCARKNDSSGCLEHVERLEGLTL